VNDVKANTGEAWRSILFDADLKLDCSFLRTFRGLMSWEMCHERGQDAVCADDGVHFMDKILAHHATPQREFGCASAQSAAVYQTRLPTRATSLLCRQ
jgi:hypothetical protein